MTSALTATPLYRFFRAGDEETAALRGVPFDVAPGEVVAVVGPSGSGKSTLLSCLAGLDEPDGGSVTVTDRSGDVHRVSHRSEAERAALRAAHVGVLFQGGNLVGHLTVGHNLALVRSLAAHRGPADPELALRLGIADRWESLPSHLSGGELARAALCVALANDPAVLVADEPTGELDVTAERDVLDLVRERASGGLAVVVASHSRAVREIADRVVTLADGTVAA